MSNIHLHRVRTNNPNFDERDTAALSTAAQARELVLHGIIVEDVVESGNGITIHYYKVSNA